MFLAGFPEEVPVRTVNRQCSSGLQAVADVAAAIRAGYYDVGVAAGVETMTKNPMKWEGGANPRVASSSAAQSCLIPMGVTSENVAERWNISREAQDSVAARSHARAHAARESGRFDSQIVPVHTTWRDPKTGETSDVVVSRDDGIREGVTTEALAKLPAVFKKGGSTTPGNASQVSDGAGCVVLARRAYAEARGLPVLARFVAFAAVGVDPKVMGIGPAVAIPEATRKAGLRVQDVDLFELNEAFASQATYCAEKLGLDPERVNVNGGAIALGHPLGATGARCVATLLHEMKRTGRKTGVVSMCIGSGMGAAGVFCAE
jgi:acetyl-CoA acetyltransferase family protein